MTTLPRWLPCSLISSNSLRLRVPLVPTNFSVSELADSTRLKSDPTPAFGRRRDTVTTHQCQVNLRQDTICTCCIRRYIEGFRVQGLCSSFKELFSRQAAFKFMYNSFRGRGRFEPE